MRTQIIFFSLIVGLSAMAFGQTEKNPPDSVAYIRKPVDAWFARDKAKHFLLSTVMTGAICHYGTYKQNWTNQNSKRLAVGITLTLSVGKEFKDRRRPDGYFSWKDMVYDVLGIAVGIGVLSQW